MRTYSHVGIITDKKPEGAGYMEDARLYVSDFTASPNAIEWLHFTEPGGCMPPLMHSSTHIAYVVDDMDKERKGAPWLVPPFKAGDNLTVGFIVEEGIPIELMQYDK